LWHIGDISKHCDCGERILNVGNVLKAPAAALRLDRSCSEAFFHRKGHSEMTGQQEKTADAVDISWLRVYSGTDL
jgi:hypothetical protein